MKRPGSRPLVATLAAVALVTVTGCANTDRVATLNRKTSAATVAGTLEKQLAIKGFPSAKVRCAKTLVLNLGTTEVCRVTGAGSHGTVRFSFGNYDGSIVASSVKPT